MGFGPLLPNDGALSMSPLELLRVKLTQRERDSITSKEKRMKVLLARSLSGLLAGLVLGLGSLVLLSTAPPKARAAEEPSHHPLHRALAELREARRELEKAPSNFGGRKKEALEATDHAIKHLDRLLGWVKDNHKEDLKQEFKDEKFEVKKGESYPRLRAAVHELKRAHKHVEESKYEYGDKKQKEEALKSIHNAIVHLEKILEYKE
jgi:hypothetical protein